MIFILYIELEILCIQKISKMQKWKDKLTKYLVIYKYNNVHYINIF